MPDNIELQKSLIRGAFHGLLNTASLLCKEFASHSEQKDIADFAETLNTLTNDLHLLIKGDSK